MFNKTKRMLALVLVCLCGMVMAESPDYGNDESTAEPIVADGTVVEGEITSTSDQDWFVFTPVQYGRYEITLTTGGGYRYCNLYQEASEGSLASIDLSSSSGTHVFTYLTSSPISSTVFLTSDATCYINIAGSGPNSSSQDTGVYTICVDLLDVTPPDYYPETFDSPQEIIVGDAPLAGTTCPDNLEGFDLDCFSFATESGHMYSVLLVNGAIGANATFDLYDGSMNAMASNVMEKIFTSTYTGNYYLNVDGGSSSYYEIWVEEIPLTPIAADGTVTGGFIGEAGDEDWFTFTPVQYGRYEITLTTGGGYRYCNLYQETSEGSLASIDLSSSSGTHVFTYLTSSPISSTVFLTSDATCYINIAGSGPNSSSQDTGVYTICVDLLDVTPPDYYPETFDSPQEIIVGDAPLAGTTCPDNLEGFDFDCFSFATEADRVYRVVLGRGAVGSSAGFDLCDDSFNYLVSNTTEKIFTSTYTGEYYLSIDGGSSSYYEIWVEEIPLTPIAADGTVTGGFIGEAGDEDWFAFTPVQYGRYEITLTTGGGYRYCNLYQEASEGSLAPIDLSSSSGTHVFTYLTSSPISSTVFLTSDATCYINVAGSGPNSSSQYTGEYTICVDLLDVTPPDYYPETFDSPQEIIVDAAPLAGTTCPDNLEDGDIDTFVFAADQWKLYQVTIDRGAVGSSAAFDLYDSNFNNLVSNNSSSYMFAAPQSGDYYISIDGGTSSFYTIVVEELEVTPVEHDGSITVNTISTSDDIDWYSFIVPQDGAFELMYENVTSSYMHFRLYSLTGTGTLSQIYDANVRAEVEEYSFDLSAGLHLIKISDAAGLYKLSVDTPLGPVCGDLEHPYPVGDITGPGGMPDCRVDLSDFAAMAENWLIDVNP